MFSCNVELQRLDRAGGVLSSHRAKNVMRMTFATDTADNAGLNWIARRIAGVSAGAFGSPFVYWFGPNRYIRLDSGSPVAATADRPSVQFSLTDQNAGGIASAGDLINFYRTVPDTPTSLSRLMASFEDSALVPAPVFPVTGPYRIVWTFSCNLTNELTGDTGELAFVDGLYTAAHHAAARALLLNTVFVNAAGDFSEPVIQLYRPAGTSGSGVPSATSPPALEAWGAPVTGTVSRSGRLVAWAFMLPGAGASTVQWQRHHWWQMTVGGVPVSAGFIPSRLASDNAERASVTLEIGDGNPLVLAGPDTVTIPWRTTAGDEEYARWTFSGAPLPPYTASLASGSLPAGIAVQVDPQGRDDWVRFYGRPTVRTEFPGTRDVVLEARSRTGFITEKEVSLVLTGQVAWQCTTTSADRDGHSVRLVPVSGTPNVDARYFVDGISRVLNDIIFRPSRFNNQVWMNVGGGGQHDLVNAWETSPTAITLEAAGAGSIVIPGPNAPGSVVPDPSEPYAWAPPTTFSDTEQDAWVAAVRASYPAVTVTLDY